MKFEEMSKEELVKYIEDINELNNGKYGLVWDREKEPEIIVEECNRYIPILKEIEDKRLYNDGSNNILIEGDNFHSLEVLNYTHKESIDVIYIDPPYNTGNKDFMYNDKFVEFEDGYRHSKWLNFMEKRLKLARPLLKETGSILLSIDDNEFAQLKLLCDKIFGDHNYIGTFIINSAPNGRDYGAMAKQHEYCLFYAKNIKKMYFKKIKDKDKKFTYKDQIGGFNIHPLYNSNVAFTPENRPKLYYPFYVNPRKNENDDFYQISLKKKKGYVEVYPPVSAKGDAQFVWRWGREKSSMYLNQEIMGHKVGEEFRIVQKMRHSEKLIRSLLNDTGYSTRRGTAELEDVLGKKTFLYPKPKNLIKVLIEATCPEEGVVLDFFAGTGTTGQAIIELNNEDDFNRRFILCTNNENNICEDITYPRLKTIISGKRMDESIYSNGLKGNIRYYKTDFVNIEGTKDQIYYDLTEKCIPMLCVKEDTYEVVEKNDQYVIYRNTENDKYTCVYFDTIGNKYDKFIETVQRIKEQKVIYIFTLGNKIVEPGLNEMKNYTIEAIPQRIYDLYKKLSRISKER